MKLVMLVLNLINVLLPLVQQIVETLQRTFPAGSGPIKKEVAMEAVTMALEADPTVTEGLPSGLVRSLVDRAIENSVRSIKPTRAKPIAPAIAPAIADPPAIAGAPDPGLAAAVAIPCKQ